jgi:hypothetical protein
VEERPPARGQCGVVAGGLYLRSIQREHRLQPPAALAKVVVLGPEPPHHQPQLDPDVNLPAPDRPAERRPQVVVVPPQYRYPLFEHARGDLRLRGLRQRQVVQGMRAPHRFRLAARLQTLRRVFPDRLQHLKARPLVAPAGRYFGPRL